MRVSIEDGVGRSITERETGAGPARAGEPAAPARVEHDAHTLLIHLSDEDGGGWSTIAVDRTTRQWAVVQDVRQAETARGAHDAL